ncbi:DUF7504 family protein [Halomicrococcus sp. NG-SE-24]|uniref:DUF7504 family protein n=1 Tax=Halomicrococcus sp. NG-SE-24 TaxID=3436928 RepID=UPI003D99C565
MDGIDGDRSPDESEVHRVHHDLDSDQALSTTITVAVADAAGVEPSDIPEQLYDVIDPEALDKLFEPRGDGTPRRGGRLSFSLYGHHVTVNGDGTVTVQPGLARIKERGGNLLVVGAVPDTVFDAASTLLLGETACGRTRVFALHDRGVSTASNRLSMADSSGEDAHVINYHTGARSAADADSRPVDPTVEPVTGDADDLRETVVDTIERLDDEREFDPAELRLCFDSLRPVVEDNAEDEIDAFLGPICRAVEDVSGMAHYVLPVEYGSRPVRAIASKFDAVVELRARDAGAQQRWHLRTTGYTTEWFDL